MALHLSMPHTRLLVRTIETEQGVQPLLADADGVPLPMQRNVTMQYDHRGLAEVTVTFAVDGESVQLVPDHMGAKR